MNPKPIKRNESIVKLSRDHHFTLLFCWKIRMGIKNKTESSRMVQYVRYFWEAHMQPHFKEEEEILFAPLKDDMVKRALDEHVLITQSIVALSVLPPGNIIDKLKQFADLVDNHVRYEERQLFPHIENRLTAEQLEAIGLQLNIQVSTDKDNYGDEFWNEKNASL